MSLTVHYNALQDKTFAYIGQQGRNRFVAKGQWTENEVRMALRIVKNFPIGSWNRNPETVQFAFALVLARNFEAIRKTSSDLVATEIFIDTASGQQSVGRRVDDQPQGMTGVEILHLDPGTGIGDTYELVYDRSAGTIAWQKQGSTSSNTKVIREGAFDVLDDTGNLFVHIRVRPDELPPEDRTESFLIEDRLSVDYLERVAENYFPLLRESGESDSVYRQRIKDRIGEIKTTIWGMKDRFRRVLGYVPRMEETREWHEDFFVAGARVGESVDFTPANPEVFDTYSITINGTKFSYVTAIPGTVAVVVAGLVAAINGGSEPVTASNIGPGTLVRVVSDEAGVFFSFSAVAINHSTGVDSQTIAYTLGSGATPGSDILSVSAETTGEVEHVLKPSTKDTYLKEDEPTANKGTETTVKVGLEAIASSRQRAVLEFDLSAIPAGSAIKSATLEMYAKAKGSAGDNRTVEIYRVARISQNWTELGATWNNLNASFDPDREGTLLTGTVIGAYKISTDLTAIVQEWLDGVKSNFGFMLIDANESVINTAWDFASREEISAEQPILRVKRTTFTPGSPTTDPTLVAKAKGSINTMFSGASSANYFIRTRVKESSRQSVNFTLSGTPGGTFVITINGVNHITTGQASISAAVADLVSKISNGPEKDNVTAADNDPIVTVTQDVPGQAFTFSSSTSGGATIAENETQQNIAGIGTALSETSPASRRIIMDTGYGVELASLEPEDAHLPSSGGATLADLPSSETDYKYGALIFGSGADKRADFDFRPNEDIAGTYRVVISYRTSVNSGVALLAVDVRVVQAGAAWDVALTNAREFKLRPPYDPQNEQHLEIRKEFAVADFTLATPSIIQLSIKRLGTDGRDDLLGDLQIVGVRFYRNE